MTPVRLGLIGLGIYLLSGRQLVINIPKLNKGGADGTPCGYDACTQGFTCSPAGVCQGFQEICDIDSFIITPPTMEEVARMLDLATEVQTITMQQITH